MGLGSKFAAASDKDDEESATASFKLSGSDKFISTGEFKMSVIFWTELQLYLIIKMLDFGLMN